MKRILILSLAFFSVAAAAHAADNPAPVCSAPVNSALPPVWSAWTAPEAITAGATIATKAPVVMGHAYTATLTPSAQMTYAVALNRPAAADALGGLFMLTVEKAGVYSIALDGKVWIDVSDGKTNYRSVAHAEAIDCSTIRKTVDFNLTPGHYTLQLSAAYKTPITLEVVAK